MYTINKTIINQKQKVHLLTDNKSFLLRWTEHYEILFAAMCDHSLYASNRDLCLERTYSSVNGIT